MPEDAEPERKGKRVRNGGGKVQRKKDNACATGEIQGRRESFGRGARLLSPQGDNLHKRSIIKFPFQTAGDVLSPAEPERKGRCQGAARMLSMEWRRG